MKTSIERLVRTLMSGQSAGSHLRIQLLDSDEALQVADALRAHGCSVSLRAASTAVSVRMPAVA